MLHGDIDNKRSFSFGFRCEGSLIEYKDSSFLDKIKNAIKGKTHRAELNQEVYSLMNYIYWNTEYTVMLVIDSENYTEEAQEFLSSMPFNQVATVLKSPSEITAMLNTGELTYYVDNNDSTRHQVQSRYAITAEELNRLLKRKYGRL